MTETLGSFIRYLRQTAYPQRTGNPPLTVTALSQLIGRNHADLSRWENNIRVPDIDILKQVIQAVHGTNEDFYYMLGLMGILQPTRFPPYEKTIAMLQQVADYVGKLNVPSYILDYRGRFWAVNQAVAEMTGLDMSLLQMLLRGTQSADGRYQLVDYLEIIFNHNLPVRAMLTNWERTARNQIARFKTVNLYRRHEPFYACYVHRMQNRLPPEDFRIFHALWDAVNFEDFAGQNGNNSDFTQHALDMLTTEIVYQPIGGALQRYTLRAETIFPYPTLFDHIVYVPEGVPIQLKETNQPVLCLWNVLPDLKERLRDEWA